MTLLESTTDALPRPSTRLPDFPVAHLSFAAAFSQIVANRALKTERCRVFREQILYLFYGALAYRTRNGSTRDQRKAPIAFLFRPSVLSKRVRYYPFDTGAAADGLFGGAFSALAPAFKKRLRLVGNGDPNVPALFAYHAFGSIANYIAMAPNHACMSYPSPFPELYRFYSADLTPGVDQRQCRIEAQFLEELALPKDLIFLGYPLSRTDEVRELCKVPGEASYVPEIWTYPDSAILNSNDLAGALAQKCAEIIARYVSL